MPYNDQFEDRIRKRFADARMEPSPDLWKRLETQLPVQKRKRIFPLWKSATLLAIAATFALLVYSAVSSPATEAAGLSNDRVAEAPVTQDVPEPEPDQTALVASSQELVEEIRVENDNKVSPENDLARPLRKQEPAAFAAIESQDGLGPVMKDGTELYIKTRLPSLSTVDVDFSLASASENIPDIEIPVADWRINPLRIHSLDKENKPGKKGLFAFFAQGGSRNSGLGGEELAFITSPEGYSNQGGTASLSADLPVQWNLYPRRVSSATVGGELFLSDNLSVQAGVGLASFVHTVPDGFGNEDARDGTINSARAIDFNDPDLPIYLTDERVVRANRLNHTSLNIPLGVNLYAGNQKRAVAVQAEILYQPTISSSNSELSRAVYDFDMLGTSVRANVEEAQTDNNLINQHALSGRVGVRFQQRIAKGFHLYGGPGLSYAITPAYSSSSAGFDQRNLGLGFEMGVKWQQLR